MNVLRHCGRLSRLGLRRSGEASGGGTGLGLGHVRFGEEEGLDMKVRLKPRPPLGDASHLLPEYNTCLSSQYQLITCDFPV